MSEKCYICGKSISLPDEPPNPLDALVTVGWTPVFTRSDFGWVGWEPFCPDCQVPEGSLTFPIHFKQVFDSL